MQVHQILPNFSEGDAIANHVLALRGLLRQWGYRSEIYAQHMHSRLKTEAHFYTHYGRVSAPENVLLYHFSIGSEVTSFVTSLPDRTILIYHNITPEHYFHGVNARARDRCRRGRWELMRLSGQVELALGVSEFNRQELSEMGFQRTGVVPVLLDLGRYDHPTNSDLLRAHGGKTCLLHVGRIAPNKRIEDLLKVLAFFRRLDPKAHLLLVGTDIDMEVYSTALGHLARRLGVADAVTATGPVRAEDLPTYYRLAACYVTMSEHEGFCVPLLEAMHLGCPIVAYAAAAVPETLGGAGVLFKEKDHAFIAEVIHHLVTARDFRDAVVRGQRERLRAFSPEVVGVQFKAALADLLAAPREGSVPAARRMISR